VAQEHRSTAQELHAKAEKLDPDVALDGRRSDTVQLDQTYGDEPAHRDEPAYRDDPGAGGATRR
jgi:hypothetical protein